MYENLTVVLKIINVLQTTVSIIYEQRHTFLLHSVREKRTFFDIITNKCTLYCQLSLNRLIVCKDGSKFIQCDIVTVRLWYSIICHCFAWNVCDAVHPPICVKTLYTICKFILTHLQKYIFNNYFCCWMSMIVLLYF